MPFRRVIRPVWHGRLFVENYNSKTALFLFSSSLFVLISRLAIILNSLLLHKIQMTLMFSTEGMKEMSKRLVALRRYL